MLRYFIAISLPDDTRERLLAVQPPPILGMRLIGHQELHLTLHFLGELSAVSRDAVHRALERIAMEAFTITLKGLGTFPTAGQSKVVWSGVECNPALLALHDFVGTALANAIGFQIEERPYSPHISLARLDGVVPLEFIENYLNENLGFHVPAIRITHFALYSSSFVEGIPRYREEASFYLS